MYLLYSFTYYFVIIPLVNFANIYLSFTAFGRCHEDYRDLHPGCVTGSLYNSVTGIYFSSLANHKYDLCSYKTWMMNKRGKYFMQPTTLCLPWLNIYRCHSQLNARLWKYLSSKSKLVDLCVWIFLCGVRCRQSHSFCFLGLKEFQNLLQRLSRESRTNPLTCVESR